MSISQYTFNGVEVPEVYGVSAPVQIKDADAATPYRLGNFSGRQFIDARKITMSGVWLPSDGQDFDDMQDSFEDWRNGMMTCGTQRLFIRTNWYYNALCSLVNDTSRQYGGIEYEATFKLPDPRAYRSIPSGGGSDGVSSFLIAPQSPGIPFNVTGTVAPPWALNLIVTGSGHSAGGPTGSTGYITFTLLATGESFTIVGMDGAGSYVVSSLTQTLSKDGVDSTAQLAGDIFEIAAGSNTIGVVFSYVTIPSGNLFGTYRESSL